MPAWLRPALTGVLALALSTLAGTLHGGGLQIACVVLAVVAGCALAWDLWRARKRRQERTSRALLKRMRDRAADLALSADVNGWPSARLENAAGKVEDDAQSCLDEHATKAHAYIDKGRALYDPAHPPATFQAAFRDRMRYVANQLDVAIGELGGAATATVERPSVVAQPKLDFGAVLPRENALVAAMKKQHREQREPVVQRLRTSADAVASFIDARDVEEPAEVAFITAAMVTSGKPSPRHAYRRRTLALYYETGHRSRAVAAFQEAVDLKMAAAETTTRIDKPSDTQELARVPDFLRAAADRLEASWR